MPYLETVKDGETEEQQTEEIEMPNLEGLSIKDNNLQLVISNEQERMDKENTIVKEQTPKAGVKVKQGSNVYVDW